MEAKFLVLLRLPCLQLKLTRRVIVFKLLHKSTVGLIQLRHLLRPVEQVFGLLRKIRRQAREVNEVREGVLVIEVVLHMGLCLFVKDIFVYVKKQLYGFPLSLGDLGPRKHL